MTTKLSIRWDGNAPGLREHTLSLSTWLDPLRTLLAATRRAATTLETNSARDADQGPYSRLARSIDLQLTAIRDGCVAIDLLCTTNDQTGSSDLPSRALAQVVRSIEAGKPSARRFLRSLPTGVQLAEYIVETNGVILVRATINRPEAQALDDSLPRLQKVDGFIIGVGFGPGSFTITFKMGSQRFTRPATQELVRRALELREERIHAMCVVGPTARVLWLRSASAPRSLPTPEERSAVILRDWAHTFEILAR